MDLFLCFQFPRSDTKSHSQSQIESHLNLALRGLEATQHQVHELVTVVKNQSQQIERQSQEIERMISKEKEKSQQIELQSQQIERQSGQIASLMSKDKEQLEKTERLMSRVEDQSQQIRRLISKDKEQSEKMERSISAVQGHPLQRERRGPINQIFPTPFKWEIRLDSVTKQSLFSIPFYLSVERGYKYLLKISRWSLDLNVCIIIVPGEFDELLSWPCKEKVRVTLDYQGMLGPDSESSVTDFEKGSVPCYQPVDDDDHDTYRVVRFIDLFSSAWKDTVLITVTRE